MKQYNFLFLHVTFTTLKIMIMLDMKAIPIVAIKSEEEGFQV